MDACKDIHAHFLKCVYARAYVHDTSSSMSSDDDKFTAH